MSSLAKQLQKLAIPGQPSLRQVVSKKRPSLLFDPEAAADIDIDTIHSLGLNGLEELISIDQNFAEFESTLFSESCKDFERTVQTRETLEDLDERILSFLRKLSPYFLLKAAQKCLEWLIRSLRVNSFNVDALMECVLPYHETNLFVRVLQLIPIKDPASSWHWLRPSQKVGSPLSKLTLVQHCISVPSFLVFLCEMVTQSLRALRSSSTTNRALLGLYTSTVVAVMEERGSVTEELISRLLPYIIKGLKSQNNDFRASSYVVVSQLATRSSLEPSLYNSLLEVITKHLGPELLSEVVCCIAVVCQTQRIQHFTKRSLKHLLKCSSLVPTLAELAHTYCLTPLLLALLSSLLASHCEGLRDDSNHDSDACMTMVISILDSIRLEENTVFTVLREFLESFLEVRGQVELSEETVRSLVAPLVQSLDAKYPKVVDRAIEKTVASPPSNMEVDDADTSEKLHLLQELLTLSLPNSRHQVLSNVSSTLTLCVYHHSAAMRTAGVREMAKSAKSLAKGSTKLTGVDMDFVSSALLARLRDDDPTVVSAVLSIKPKVLFKVLPVSDLVPSLLSLLKKRRLHKLSLEWQDCAVVALQALTSPSMMAHAPGLIDDVIVVGISLLFTGRHSNVLAGRVGEVISQSVLGKAHCVLSRLGDVLEGEVWGSAVGENVKDPQTLSSACDVMFDRTGQQLANSTESHSLLSKMLSTLTTLHSDQMAYYALLSSLGSCVCHMTKERLSTQLHLVWYLLKHIKSQLSSLPQVSAVECDGLRTALQPLVLKHPNRSRGHTNVLMWVLSSITNHLLSPDTLSTVMWLEVPRGSSSEEDLYYQGMLSLFSMLTDCVESEGGMAMAARHMISAMIQKHFGKCGTLVRFLAMIWTSPILRMECDSEPGFQFPFDELPHSHFQFQVTPTLQARALAIAASHVKSLDDGAAVALLSSMCPIVPSLLFPLMSPTKAIRQSAVSCLLSLFNATQTPPTIEHPYHHLLNLLCASQLELTTDPASLVELFRQLCIKEGVASPAKSKRRQSRKSLKSEEPSLGVVCVQGVLGHVVMFGMPPHIQVVLLRVLSEFDHQIKLSACCTLLTTLLRNDGTSTVHDLDLLQLGVSSFTPKMASSFDSEGESFQLLLSLLKTVSLGNTCPQDVIVTQVTPEFFSALSGSGLRQTVLRTMIDVLVTCERSSTSTLFKQQITKLPLSADMVCTELSLHSESLGGDSKPPPTPAKKSRRSKAPPSTVTPSWEDSDSIPLPWKRVTVILELLQLSLETVRDPHLLVPDLFSLLNRCLGRESGERERLEYTQQLLLSTLQGVLTLLCREGAESARGHLPEGQVNVELVVQCVRLSLNPQIHHHALTLLSSAAAIFPGPVLHNIMSIFTFMGASVLRHDDQYSFKVITRTIDSVIPPLIQSGSTLLITTSASSRSKSARPTTVGGVVKEIIQVFVDSLPHIPDHRRLPLLTHLLTSVGAEAHLHTMLGLIVEKQVVGDESSVEVERSFPLLLTQQFSPTTQLTAMTSLTHYLSKLPQEKPKTSSKLRQLPADTSALFNIAAHTDDQLRQFRTSSLSLLLSLISDKQFGSKISQVESSESMEAIVLKLLQTVLSYSLTLNKIKSSTPHHETSYWQGLVTLTLSLTDKVISLLSPQAFLDIVSQLVTEETVTGASDLQRKALEILIKQLESNKMRFTADHDSTMLELVDVLVGVATQDHTPSMSRQRALFAIKLFCGRLANKNQQYFIKVTKSVLSIPSEGVDSEVLSSCLLCVAENCSFLSAHSIPILRSILSQVLAPLGQENPESLLSSAVIALGVIVRTLPNFLSSYINDIITKLCHPLLTCGKSVELIKDSAYVRLNLSERVPSRVLLPAFLKCYPAVLLHGHSDCVVALLSMLSTVIEHMDKDEVKGHCPLLLNVFTSALDYRATQESCMSAVAIDTVERECVHAFTVLVVRLSEALFRPMFIQLLDWATQTSAPKERLITFYHLADSVADKLKNLFLLFAGHIVKNVTTLLTAIHEDSDELLFRVSDETDSESDPVTKSCVLLDYIVQCLTKCFMYDRGGIFLTKDRFEALMQPLVNQVTNTLGGSERFSTRVESGLAPCVSHFAVSAGKDSLWKPLNYQLLLKTKHSKSEVRFGALKVLQEMYLKLGEEFMVLLPETIPFLAECMEDDCEEVESLTQSVVSTIEQIVGEPIQQYF